MPNIYSYIFFFNLFIMYIQCSSSSLPLSNFPFNLFFFFWSNSIFFLENTLILTKKKYNKKIKRLHWPQYPSKD